MRKSGVSEMVLKVHATRDELGSRADGKTLCGEGFFASSRSLPHSGEYQSYRRIGGIRVVCVSEFEANSSSCLKCIEGI